MRVLRSLALLAVVASSAEARQGEPTPRPYPDVTRGSVKTRAGLMTAHRIGSKLLYEIPRRTLGKDLLVVMRVTKTTAGPGGSGGGVAVASEITVRWERRGHQVLLRRMIYDMEADSADPLRSAVEAVQYPAILAVYNVEAYGADSAPVIDVTKLYTSPMDELSPRLPYGGTADPSRSFIERVMAFPENVEVEATLTASSAGGGAPARGRSLTPPVTASYVVRWSMIQLPETPMMPRLLDKRLTHYGTSRPGYHPVAATATYRSSTHGVAPREYILRFRLECSERRVGNLCYPVKPIVMYVDPATPAWMVPWIKKGILNWQPAFEAAGFKDAIIAKEAPSKAEDPDWSPDDARYSVVRWLATTTEDSRGPNIFDPRSGEILAAHPEMFHNASSLVQAWYWTQCAALDPRTRTLPLPDSLIGQLVSHVVSHEIGHSLGYNHNMKASAMYPIDSIRNRDFVRRESHTSTLMDYTRFNYVAQPEDSIAPEDLSPKVGAYDMWITHWGYAPIPGARTPEEEWPTLDAWSREQDAKPWLRSTTRELGFSSGDRRDTDNDAVGDDDPVQAATLGILNFKRALPLVMPATAALPDRRAEVLRLYDELITRQVGHVFETVAGLIGGFETQEKYGSQPGPRFTPVAGSIKREAARYLIDQALPAQTWLMAPDISEYLGRDYVVERVAILQQRILSGLLRDVTLARLAEDQALAAPSDDLYTAVQYLAAIRAGVWRELSAPAVRIDPFQRRLQQNYLDTMLRKLAAPPGRQQQGSPTPEPPSLILAELQALNAQLAAAVPRAADSVTRAHLVAAQQRLRPILSPDSL